MKTHETSGPSSPYAFVTACILCLVLAGISITLGVQAQSLRDQVSAQQARIDDLEHAVPRTASSDKEKDREIRLLRQMLEDKDAASNKAPPAASRSAESSVSDGDAGEGSAGETALNPPPGRSGDGRRGEDPTSWLERLRTEDPERYERIQKEREERRQRMESRLAEQYARLDERLQSAQTQQEADLVVSLADTLNQMNDVRLKWEGLAQVPEEQRQQQFQQLIQQSRDLYGSYTTLRSQDRQLQLQQLATQLGYQNEADAKQFVEAINRIYSETDTSMRGLFGFGFGAGNSGRRGGRDRAGE
jgi:hypothetical protein